MRRQFLTAVTLLFSITISTQAADIPPAADIVRKIASQQATTAPADNSPVALTDDIKTLSEKVAMIAPDQAAAQWLKLFDRYAQMPHVPAQSGRRWEGFVRAQDRAGASFRE